ncbi:MAG: cysteine desulfurase family protein [Oscillospiraceae bacterium]
MIYLDNAATTRVSEAAADAVAKTLREQFGNPSSLYDIGFEAQKTLESAREKVARALGCKSSEVFFTSGGTESNNLAILGAARARQGWANEIVITAYEHPSVENCARELEREGFAVRRIAPDSCGRVSAQKIIDAVTAKTALVCAMSVNNETGAKLDVSAIAREVKSKNHRTAVHCDNVQGFAKHQLSLDGGIDTASASAHKLHGPKGIGALYIRGGFNLDNVLFGGHQERGMRPGTENVPYAAGFAAALEEAKLSETDVAMLRARLAAGLANIDNVVLNSPADGSEYIVNFSLKGCPSEPLLRWFSGREIYVSGGSACTKGERSRTLAVMGLDDSIIDSAVRVSFSTDNTADDVDALLALVPEAQKEFSRVRK